MKPLSTSLDTAWAAGTCVKLTERPARSTTVHCEAGTSPDFPESVRVDSRHLVVSEIEQVSWGLSNRRG